MKQFKVVFLVLVAVCLVLAGAFLLTSGGGTVGGASPSANVTTPSTAASTQDGFNFSGKTWRFASLGVGSAWYVYAATLADVMQKYDSDLRFDVLPYSGGIGNVLLQAKGDCGVSISSNITNTWARQGIMAFEETGPNPDLRCLVSVLDEMYVGIVVRNGSGIENLRDIAEKQMPIHMFTAEKGNTSEYTAQVVLASLGITYDDIRKWGGSVEHTDFTSITNAAKDGKVDLFIQQVSAGHASFTELCLTANVRIVQLDQQSLDYMSSNGYALAVMPANSFHNQTSDVQCASVTSSFNCNASLPDEAAYKMVKAIYEHPKDLEAGHKALAGFKPQLAGDEAANGGLPIHPGALKYYQEVGIR